MKFKIKKEVDNTGTVYWTTPANIFIRLWYSNPISVVLHFGTQNAWDCWTTKKKANQHIKRWNSGYYKKKYYSKWV